MGVSGVGQRAGRRQAPEHHLRQLPLRGHRRRAMAVPLLSRLRPVHRLLHGRVLTATAQPTCGFIAMSLVSVSTRITRVS